MKSEAKKFFFDEKSLKQLTFFSQKKSFQVTGACIYVDNGLNAMGLAVDSQSLIVRD